MIPLDAWDASRCMSTRNVRWGLKNDRGSQIPCVNLCKNLNFFQRFLFSLNFSPKSRNFMVCEITGNFAVCNPMHNSRFGLSFYWLTPSPGLKAGSYVWFRTCARHPLSIILTRNCARGRTRRPLRATAAGAFWCWNNFNFRRAIREMNINSYKNIFEVLLNSIVYPGLLSTLKIFH